MEILEETTVEVESSKKNKRKQRKTRKRRSSVWLEFKEQELKKRVRGRRESYVFTLRCKPYLEKKSKSETHITFEGGDVNKMMAWKFDQNKSKRALAHMIVVDELPFSFVRNSVDNASANDSAIDFMKMILEKSYNCLLKGKWMHIRCTAHVINLIVQDGMKKVDNLIEEVANVYEDAFSRYDLEDVDFGNDIRSRGGKTGGHGHRAKGARDKTYIKDELKLFFEDYVRIHAPSSTTSSTLGKRQRTTDIRDEPDYGDMLRSRMKKGQSSNSSTSELDKYVGEICEPLDKSVHFDILQWWKVNSQRFPILTLVARDALVVPISTVASESVFVRYT
nr:zinc finger BED domain-containing protein RICESLEEPER 2-like [Tanacetum cinerariifolium]